MHTSGWVRSSKICIQPHKSIRMLCNMACRACRKKCTSAAACDGVDACAAPAASPLCGSVGAQVRNTCHLLRQRAAVRERFRDTGPQHAAAPAPQTQILKPPMFHSRGGAVHNEVLRTLAPGAVALRRDGAPERLQLCHAVKRHLQLRISGTGWQCRQVLQGVAALLRVAVLPHPFARYSWGSWLVAGIAELFALLTPPDGTLARPRRRC